MNDDNDLSSTIVAKSDQMNADEILEPITITITRVDKVTAKDQPIHIHSEGRQPFKPCLTMRRMLIAAWGKYKDAWVGQSMMIYCDPEVMWAGKAQGGLRVSHVTGIDKPVSQMLAVTRGRKAMFTLLPLEKPQDYTHLINEYGLADGNGKAEIWKTLNPQERSAVFKEFDNNQEAN